MKKKSPKPKTKYSKPILEIIGPIDTQTGGIVRSGGKASNQSDGTGVPATKAAAMPE